LSRWLLSISREGDSTTSLGSLFQCSVTLRGKKFFLMFRWNFLFFSLCPLPLVLLLGTTEKSLVPLLVTYVCPTDLVCWPAWCEWAQGGGKCDPPCFLKDFLAVKPGCGLTREKNHGMGGCGAWGHAASERGQESSPEGCMCLMGVCTRRPEIIIWSKKPCEGCLYGDAGGKCVCAADPQQSNKCVRVPGLARASYCGTVSTVFLAEE